MRFLRRSTERTSCSSFLIVLFTTIVVPSTALRGQERPARGAEFEVVVSKNVMVPMRDGVRLATDVYRPARDGRVVEGRLPVVLTRTPYGKNRGEDQAGYFAKHGYVYVAQDLRGRYDSEGVFHPFGADSSPDGHDTAEWIVAQPWSDGRIATIGGSYGGLTQFDLAVTDPPGLSVMALQWIWDDAFRTGIYTGGAFNMRRIAWIVGQALRSQEAARDPVTRAGIQGMNDNFMMWVEGFPLSLARGSSPLRRTRNYEEFLAGVIENNRYGPFWQRPGFKTDWDRFADVPVMWMGGWYDIYTLRTPIQYQTMKSRAESPQMLLMGAWCHCNQRITYVGTVEFGPDAAMDTDSLRLAWYDAVLRGGSRAILDGPPVLAFRMGGGDGHRTQEGRMFHGGRWQTFQDWPPPEARNTRYFFHVDGTLRTERPRASDPTRYIFDPENPVPTVGGSGAFQGSWGGYAQVELGSGPFDQRDLSGTPLRLRPDVVVFQTPPLERDVEVTGPITVTLYASSSAVNTDFTAKLIDVYPPNEDYPEGYEMNFQDGVIRAAFRESLTDPTPLEPGRIYEFTIEIPPTSNLFQRGHRIRVDISSSNWPRFDRNPGTMDPVWERRRYLKQENRIYHDPERLSHVVLPIILR